MRRVDPAAGSLRVLLTVHHDLVHGAGAPGSTLALAEELERRGHVVEIVGFGLLRHRRTPTLDSVAFPHAVSRLVERRFEAGGIDVVDASTGDLGFLNIRRVRASGVAVFTRSHGLEQLADAVRRRGAASGNLALRRRYAVYHGGWRLREVARSLRNADGVFVLNTEEERFVVEQLGVAPERVWKTSPVVDEAIPVLPRAEERDILILGPDTWRKGADTASAAMYDALTELPGATATWRGVDDPSATAASIPADVRSRVEVAGAYGPKELASLLASHRVLLVASRFEGLPVTLLEAVRAGIVPVASDVPGVRDVLEGGAGLLVGGDDPRGLARGAVDLLADEAARDRCRLAGAAVTAVRSSGPVVDGVVAAYRTMLSVKRPG